MLETLPLARRLHANDCLVRIDCFKQCTVDFRRFNVRFDLCEKLGIIECIMDLNGQTTRFQLPTVC